jgi:hypothetical protein
VFPLSGEVLEDAMRSAFVSPFLILLSKGRLFCDNTVPSWRFFFVYAAVRMAVVTEQTPGGGGRAVLGSYQKPRGGMCLDRKINVMLPCVLYDSTGTKKIVFVAGTDLTPSLYSRKIKIIK